MQASDLKPAKDYAINYGVKAFVYGAPGSAKTPLINTAPSPILLSCENGLLSMRNSNVPTFQAFTGDAIDDFFSWFFSSAETKKFDTLAIDSVSQICDIYLQDALTGKSKSGNKAHGLAAYGLMATNVMKHMKPLLYFPQKHCYLICKQSVDNGVKQPYFPGKQLVTELPHIPDFILQLGIQNVPNVGQVLAFQCQQSIDVVARNRTGNLGQYEQPDFGALVRKAMET